MSEPTFEELVSLGQAAREKEEASIWELGDIALLVLKVADEHRRGSGKRLVEWAKEVGLMKSAAYERRSLCKFYPKAVREKLPANVTIEHARIAMRKTGELEAAVALINDMADKNMTPDEANAKHGGGESLSKIAEVEAVLVNGRLVISQINEIFNEVGLVQGQHYFLRVYEKINEEEAAGVAAHAGEGQEAAQTEQERQGIPF